MADEKISASPAASSLSGTEIVPVVQGGNNKRTTAQAIANLAPPPAWGDITGDLADQTDLQTALDDKADDAATTTALAGKANTSHNHAASDITSGLLPVARGGTGTATPGLVQGTNVTITGTWPNQTVNAAGGGGGNWGSITGTLSDQTDLQTALDAKAPLASPTLTGTPAAPTAAANTNTTQIATTAFAKTEADDAQAFAIQRANHTGTQAQSTVTDLVTDLAAKAPLASPTFTGTPAAPTATAGTNTTQVATTAFVTAADAVVTAAIPAAARTAISLTTTGSGAASYNNSTGVLNVPTPAGGGDVVNGGQASGGLTIGTQTNNPVKLLVNNVIVNELHAGGYMYSPDLGSYYRMANNIFSINAGGGIIEQTGSYHTVYAGSKYMQWIGGVLNLEGDAHLQNTLGGIAKEASARLQVDSTTKGSLPFPRMTSTQRDAISSPAAGLHIYNTTTNEVNFYNGSAWQKYSYTAA